MTKMEKPKGRLIRLLELGDMHLLSKIKLNALVNEMVDSFPYPHSYNRVGVWVYDFKEISNWFDKYLRKGQGYTHGSCQDCEWHSTEICDECIKCEENGNKILP